MSGGAASTGKRVTLGVTGSIAAYKAAELASQLVKRGHDVTCVLTRAARELVTPATFHPLTGNPVYGELFEREGGGAGGATSAEYRVEHVGLADRTDCFVIAPATANTIARLAHGLADDFLSTLVLAYVGPVVIAPAMNDNMYLHPAVMQNLDTLREFGYLVVEPEEGALACGRSGIGRLASYERILAVVEDALRGEAGERREKTA